MGAVFLALLPLSAAAATYYLDSAQGNDGNSGLAPAQAWRTLAAAAREFAPGDQLLLHAGGHWDGQALQPRGSGTQGRPICIDRYGDGPAPALNGAGQVPAVLRLDNQEFWEIANLDIANAANSHPALLRGVEIRAEDCGWRRHLVLRNLVVHDVSGPPATYQDGDNTRKSYGGIAFLIQGRNQPTAWEDVLIQGCTIRDVSAVGLVFVSSWTRGHRTNDANTWRPSRRVVIRGNTFERTARNGLIVRACTDPLIEHNLFKACAIEGSGNACFAFDCDGALFQYNEATGTKFNPGDVDAAGFDSDWNCRGSIFQYNYSHDNDYGFILLCCNGRGFNDGTVVRYNISQNDGGNLIRISGTVTHSQIYNNTLYAGKNMPNPHSPGDPPRLLYFKSWNGWSNGTVFSNNIFYNDCPGAVYDFGQSRDNRFDHNLFFGFHPPSEPADPGKLTENPDLTRPGGATAGWAAPIAAYAPRPGSPVLAAGMPISDQAGLSDYAGRPIEVRRGRIDLGALGPVAAPP